MVILFTPFTLLCPQNRIGVKQNNSIIFVYDLMLHTLINKILHVNIMWSDTQPYYFGFTANTIRATSALEYVANTQLLFNKSTPHYALKNYLMLLIKGLYIIIMVSIEKNREIVYILGDS